MHSDLFEKSGILFVPRAIWRYRIVDSLQPSCVKRLPFVGTLRNGHPRRTGTGWVNARCTLSQTEIYEFLVLRYSAHVYADSPINTRYKMTLSLILLPVIDLRRSARSSLFMLSYPIMQRCSVARYDRTGQNYLFDQIEFDIDIRAARSRGSVAAHA